MVTKPTRLVHCKETEAVDWFVEFVNIECVKPIVLEEKLCVVFSTVTEIP